ncbi:MAG: hypothetical protein IKN07_00400 [Lachnospiraceae bacterium]|nr:hypothetical protein [Lachnospiraceae bacterium]MBR3734317.1 hypothetical protein [Lachnospiraceae bacterium]
MNYTAFFEGKEPDDLGRYLSKILRFGRIRMELTHNYIQRLFPLAEESRFSKCDLITKEYITAFQKSILAQDGMRSAYQKMLWFWKLDGEQYKNSIYRHWNTYNNHNHWRMSRVLKSLQLLGMEEEYKDFSMRIRWIIDHPKQYRVTGDTVKIWMEYIDGNR